MQRCAFRSLANPGLQAVPFANHDLQNVIYYGKTHANHCKSLICKLQIKVLLQIRMQIMICGLIRSLQIMICGLLAGWLQAVCWLVS